MTPRLLALPLLLVLAACGTDASPEVAPTTVPATTPAAAPTLTPAPTAAAVPTPVESKQFFSPSGGITCFASVKGAVCEVSDHRWTLPSQPADCDLDWGGMVEVRESKAELGCHGDTGFGVEPKPVLAYGDALTMGDFRCSSARSGMTCVNVRTRHGFEVSRESYRLF